MITTSGILSFDDCEKVVHPEMRKALFQFLPSQEKIQYCVILLSEIPITVNEFAVDDFKLVPMSTEWHPFKPYGLLLHVPIRFDFLTAPLFAEALAPILSFSLRRRVKAYRRSYDAKSPPKELDEYASTRLPSVSVGPEASLQQKLSKEEQIRRLETFAKIYETLMKMNGKEYLAVLRALHLYQLSLLNYREDIGLAYTLLVASIESVAQCFLNLEFSFSSLPEAEEWGKTFAELKISEPHVAAIKKKLVKKERFLGLKFRRFIKDYLPASFWTSADSRAKEFDDHIEGLGKEHFGAEFKERRDHFERYWWLYTPERKVTRNELDSVLKSIYDLRSNFAHAGISPPSEVIDDYETAEIKVEIDNKGRVKYRRAIPSYFWFERVVHESISKLLRIL
jgi:hypothetical protein